MIPIVLQPEPKDFDQKVRAGGLKWFKDRQIDTSKPLPKGTEPANYWTKCIPDLRKAYGNICAYACIRIEPVTGDATVEHFKPKSLYPNLAYEWDNYLLVCGTMNGRKSNAEDVLSPFLLEPETFWLNFLDGTIRPNPQSTQLQLAQQTIKRLKLNHPDCNELRLLFWEEFLQKEINKTQLRKKSPFVYLEAQRQNLL